MLNPWVIALAAITVVAGLFGFTGLGGDDAVLARIVAFGFLLATMIAVFVHKVPHLTPGASRR